MAASTRILKAGLELNLDGIFITIISTLPPRGEIMAQINTRTTTAKPRPDNRSGVEWKGHYANVLSKCPRTGVSEADT